jgi:hypothetical protein
MTFAFHPKALAARGRRALSLIEVMVVVALLVVIIFGLVLMFNQTRKAFTVGLNQGDYMEAGRSAMDIIMRDLEQMTPTYQTNVDNFYADISPNYVTLSQPLVEPTDLRTNTLEMCYFTTKYNQQWSAFGYKVDPNSMFDQVGTLYRYSVTLSSALDNRRGEFAQPILDTNYHRVVDGVISFRVRAYDSRGIDLRGRNPASTVTALPNRGEYFYRFTQDAVPGYVEVELALIEGRTLERYRSLTNNPNRANALNFLTSHAGQVHVFRQRVAIRTVDPSTQYPFVFP